MNSHDQHYKRLDAQGICVIEEMERIMGIYYPNDPWRAKMALNLALAKKYELRAGSKGEPEKDMDKKRNYEFRALNGRWPWDGV